MKLRQLEALIAIAEGHGVAGAAQKLSISQPAVTKTLSNLEVELGVDLFDRSDYRLKLTQVGQRLALRARAINSEIAVAQKEIEEHKLTGQEFIRIHTAPGALPRLIPQALHLARSHAPNVSLEFCGEFNSTAPQKFKDLAEGVYDLLIYTNEDYLDLSGFRVEHLLDVEMIVLASRNHPALKLTRPTLADLVDYEWLFPSHEGVPMRLIAEAFREVGQRVPKRNLRLLLRQMIFSFLDSGDYLAFVPFNPSMIEKEAEKFQRLQVPMPEMKWKLYMIQRLSSPTPTGTQFFMDALRELASPYSQS